MIFLRTICRSFVIKRCKFCTKSNDSIKELVKNNYIQKYFDYIQKNGIDENLPKDTKFFVDQLISQRKEFLSNVQSLGDLEKSAGKNEDDFREMLFEEKFELHANLTEVELKLLDALAPSFVSSDEVIVEISAGVGGKEAMLFASELRDMYLGYVGYKGWNVSFQEFDTSELGGLRHASIFIDGPDTLSHLRHESGVHRVQRVPITEKSGRIHTSTVAVAVFPRSADVDIKIDDKDLLIETKRSSGAGGQHVNKTESAVRITHIPSGIVVDCQTDRSQIKNREIAKQKLFAKLYTLQEKERISSFKQSRKLQIGTSARSDKIRTYNFPQDRITDHRILKSLHNLEVFLEGGEPLDSLIQELINFSEIERFESFVSSLKEKSSAIS